MTSSCDAESPSGARSDWQLRPGPGTQRNFGLLGIKNNSQNQEVNEHVTA
ncbi:hypothetical protein ACRRTK_010587 [Alexandromys fortis]